MLIIEVFEKILQRKIAKKDGSELTITYQEAEILRQGKRPKSLEVTVPRSCAYIEGLYTLTGSSFRPDDLIDLHWHPT